MALTALPADPTLDEIRSHLAPIIGRNAAFDGWSVVAVDMAAEKAGISREIARLAFDGGPTAMIDAWFAHVDDAMLAAWPPERLAALKFRDRIRTLVETRLDLLARDRESLRRALAILSMPQNLRRSARLAWRAADAMWRAAGDASTDYNHYTKRGLLAGIYSATLLVFIDDESDGHADTRAFLARRIDGVMRFEKAKSRIGARAERRPSLARFIGRLRYRAR